jgi:transposase
MPQALLPMIPDGASQINGLISVIFQDKQWTYFCGVQPVFTHPENDHKSFRMFTAQLCCQGVCTQAQIIRTFGVSKNSVLRSVAKYRREEISGFYRPRKSRGPSVMTAQITVRTQSLLDRGHSRREVAEELGLHYDTLRKAIDQGRVHLSDKATSVDAISQKSETSSERTIGSDKTTRSDADAAAGDEMGMACTRPAERVLAAVGKLPGGATTQFQSCRDVSYGGVLCALPALAENGLFRHLKTLPALSGYYMKLHVILLLAYMALCRIKIVEKLQYETPGELGKLMGLDRIPEVRCLRKKLAQLSQNDSPQQWAALLSQDWMQQSPELAGTLYVDGHVRLYHGKLTQLPRRYVSRQRLCLRGMTDYWVNDALGQPFFSVERPVDHGLLEALRNDIVPRLLQEVPNQPTAEQLEADPYLCRFVIVFDREGYSPDFFREMWQQRIACITYHKYPKDPWPESEFKQTQVPMPNGEGVVMKLAERGSWIGNQREGLWVREVRKLTDSGHQTSLISTAFGRLGLENAGQMFSRWSQENFFRYMMEHFEIDALSEYGTEVIPETNQPVVNPQRRQLERDCRSVKSKLTRLQARFAALTLHPQTEVSQIPKWQRKKADLQDQIEQFENELATLKERKQSTPKHLAWDDLPESEKFERLTPSRKRLTDTVKLIAYRAETALASIVREKMSHVDEARSLIRELFRCAADILPNEASGVLEVRLHTLANPRSNRAVQHLLDHLNATEYTYPGTNLRLLYSLSASVKKDEMVSC